MSAITHLFSDEGEVELLKQLLLPQDQVIRIFQHWPSAEMSWWDALVPLRRDGENRQVKVHGLAYDVELSRSDFLDWIDDFRGGITLLQSASSLPGEIHPLRFRDDGSFMSALQANGASLLFELPHPGETCRITSFSDQALSHVRASGLRLLDVPPLKN